MWLHSEQKFRYRYATVGADYGLKDRLDLNGNLHLLPIAFSMLGFDIGATWYPVLNRGLLPTVGVQPGLLVLTSFKSGVSDRLRVYPCLSGSFSWKAGKGTAYGGLNLTVPFSSPDYDDEAPSTILSPFVGYRWELWRNYQLLTELKWHAANVRSTQLAVDYLPVNDHGVLTTLFSLVKSF